MNKALKVFVVVIIIIILFVIAWIAFRPYIVQWLGVVFDYLIPSRGVSDMGGIQ